MATRYVDLGPVVGPPGADGAPGTTKWEGITDKPESFPPASHNHDASDITGGTLPVSRGGTGRSTMTSGYFLRGNGTGAVILSSATSARQAMSAVTPVGPTTVTLYAASWSGSGPWTQQVSVSGVTANDNHLHVYESCAGKAFIRKKHRNAGDDSVHGGAAALGGESGAGRAGAVLHQLRGDHYILFHP